MPLTPEDAQFVTNLQQRVLANVAAGRPTNHDITEDDVRRSLSILRADRSKAVAAGAEKKPRKKKETGPTQTEQAAEAAISSKFGGLNLD